MPSFFRCLHIRISMMADLCHFVISFCRCEIMIIFVVSPRINDKTTRNNKINKAPINKRHKIFSPLFIFF